MVKDGESGGDRREGGREGSSRSLLLVNLPDANPGLPCGWLVGGSEGGSEGRRESRQTSMEAGTQRDSKREGG